MKQNIKEKVLKEIEKKSNIHICFHKPECEGYDENFPEHFTYADFRELLGISVDLTLAEVGKVLGLCKRCPNCPREHKCIQEKELKEALGIK